MKGVRLTDILFKAVELNKPNLLCDLLETGGHDVNMLQDDEGSALLHTAAASGTLYVDI